MLEDRRGSISCEVERELACWHPAYAGALEVSMPPAWDRNEPSVYTLLVADAEVDAEATRDLYRRAARLGVPNPRLLTPAAISLASLYHPRLFVNLAKGPFARLALGACATRPTAARVATVRSWLQSTLFLAGVTLSAAIVQNRWSTGTFRSKLLRLWQAGAVAERVGFSGLSALGLQAFVRELAASGMADSAKWYELKKMYGAALRSLVQDQPYEPRLLRPICAAHPLRERFGFMRELQAVLGGNLRSVIAYGSAVTSPDFADYDLLLVVSDARAALAKLGGTSPRHLGKELNVSLHDEADFHSYQLASGDNLVDYGVCLHGEVIVPHKPAEDLLHRNLSFGWVRLRQLMGMAAHTQLTGLSTSEDDKLNLHGYFVKIPLNIFKGTHGVRGKLFTKAQVTAVMQERFGYDVQELTAWCRKGRSGDALATATWCTQALMKDLNSTFDLYRTVPIDSAQVWSDLASETQEPEVGNEIRSRQQHGARSGVDAGR